MSASARITAREVEVAVAGRGEHAGQHPVEEALPLGHDPVEHRPPHVLGMHVDHPLRMAADQVHGVDAAQRRVAGVDHEADVRAASRR